MIFLGETLVVATQPGPELGSQFYTVDTTIADSIEILFILDLYVRRFSIIDPKTIIFIDRDPGIENSLLLLDAYPGVTTRIGLCDVKLVYYGPDGNLKVRFLWAYYFRC